MSEKFQTYCGIMSEKFQTFCGKCPDQDFLTTFGERILTKVESYGLVVKKFYSSLNSTIQMSCGRVLGLLDLLDLLETALDLLKFKFKAL
jgi:hypothetical protein